MRVGAGTVLVPIRQRAGDLESAFTLNETGALIWELINGQRSVTEIRERVEEEFEVGRDAAEHDLTEFLDRLEAIGAVERL
jgi:hypothetical protein